MAPVTNWRYRKFRFWVACTDRRNRRKMNVPAGFWDLSTAKAFADSLNDEFTKNPLSAAGPYYIIDVHGVAANLSNEDRFIYKPEGQLFTIGGRRGWTWFDRYPSYTGTWAPARDSIRRRP